MSADRCPAAHPEDARPCSGPGDAVTATTATGDRVPGCIRHAAATAASGSRRIEPGTIPGAHRAALELALRLRPFDFTTEVPR